MRPITNPEARQWASYCHYAALAGLVVPFGGIFGPLIVWQMKKNELPEIEEHGKEALNFQISLAIYGFVSAILVLVVIGILFLLAIMIAAIVMPIIAGMAAGNGQAYRYPLTLRIVT